MGIYGEFFKQQQFKMDIFENCQDPYNNLFEDSDQFPTNPYYPPDAICAKTSLESVCFFAGESGSPLMIKQDQNPDKLYIEGFASYMEGKDGSYIISTKFIFTFFFRVAQNW